MLKKLPFWSVLVRILIFFRQKSPLKRDPFELIQDLGFYWDSELGFGQRVLEVARTDEETSGGDSGEKGRQVSLCCTECLVGDVIALFLDDECEVRVEVRREVVFES